MLYQVTHLALFHFFFPHPGVCLVLLYETFSSIFSLCLTFSVFMKLGKTVPYPGLKVVSLCRSVPMQAVPSGFGTRAGAEATASWGFFQGTLGCQLGRMGWIQSLAWAGASPGVHWWPSPWLGCLEQGTRAGAQSGLGLLP